MELWCLLSPPLECVTFEYGALVWSETVHQMHWLWGLQGGEGQGWLSPVCCPLPSSMSYKLVLQVPRRGHDVAKAGCQ